MINDRGPYYGGRILDLSYGSFSKLASPGQGTARICFSRI
jgi:rare lipoprotein A